MKWVVRRHEATSKRDAGVYYWIGITRAAGIGFASWTSDVKDATKYGTKREASRVCEAHKRRTPKAADRYSIEAI